MSEDPDQLDQLGIDPDEARLLVEQLLLAATNTAPRDLTEFERMVIRDYALAILITINSKDPEKTIQSASTSWQLALIASVDPRTACTLKLAANGVLGDDQDHTKTTRAGTILQAHHYFKNVF